MHWYYDTIKNYSYQRTCIGHRLPGISAWQLCKALEQWGGSNRSCTSRKAIVLTHKQITLHVPLLSLSRLLPTWLLNLTVSVKISFINLFQLFVVHFFVSILKWYGLQKAIMQYCSIFNPKLKDNILSLGKFWHILQKPLPFLVEFITFMFSDVRVSFW